MDEQKKWFGDLDGCVECGTTEKRHHGHGLCVNCYSRWVRKQNPEKYREIHHRYEKTDKRKEWRKKYESTEERKQYMIEQARKYRESHKEICLERTQKWREQNHDKLHEYDLSRRDVKLVRKYGQDALRKMMEYDYACQKCGSRQRVAIHHIDWNPENNTYENFAVLCQSCHSKVHTWIPMRLRSEIYKEWMSLPLEVTDGEIRVRTSPINHKRFPA